MAPVTRSVSQQGLAGILGLSTRQIRNLEAEGMPHEADGNRKTYPIPEAVQWYVAREQERATPTDFDEAKARKMAAEAETAELELARMRARLVAVDDVVKEQSRIYDHMRAKILSAGAKYAPATVGLRTIAESQVRWDAAMRELMELLAETDDEFDADAA
jgi:terminase small subunit / prophage DNA-packing protein